MLKKARQIALENSMQAGDSYKKVHDAKASTHSLKEGDMAYLDNQLFLGKNKNFSQRWIGPYKVTKVLNDQNVELQISPKRCQLHSAYRLKKFIDPANSKFLDEKIKQRESTDGEENEFITDRRRNEELERKNEKLKWDNLIKAAIVKRITRSMTNKLMKKHTPQAIAAINNLIIPEEEKVKLCS